MFRFGINSKLPYKDVDEISNSNMDSNYKIYQILTIWREKFGQQADLNEIITVLQDINNDVVSLIESLQSLIHQSVYNLI